MVQRRPRGERDAPSRGSRARRARLALGLAPAPAAAQSRCTSQKLKAGGIYFSGFAKCLSKGLAKGASPDPLCVAKAQVKLDRAFVRAERKSDCRTIGDFLPVQDVLDDALPDLLEAVDPPPPTCCAFASPACIFTTDGASCTNFGGTPGAAGTLCSGTGTCELPGNVTVGPCCATPDVPDVAGQCISGLLAGPSCQDPGEVLSDGRCHPALGCIPAGEVRSRCSAAKLKAAGAYAAATAKCEAKAAQKGVPADVVCLGRAQSKLQRAFAKAEKKGDCLATGELADARQETDEGLAILFEILEPPPAVCCQNAGGCFWTADDAACELFVGAAPGGAGTICGGDGACAPPPVPEGPCCEGATIGPNPNRCAGGFDAGVCTGAGGTVVPDAVCLPAQLCID